MHGVKQLGIKYLAQHTGTSRVWTNNLLIMKCIPYCLTTVLPIILFLKTLFNDEISKLMIQKWINLMYTFHRLLPFFSTLDKSDTTNTSWTSTNRGFGVASCFLLFGIFEIAVHHKRLKGNISVASLTHLLYLFTLHYRKLN